MKMTRLILLSITILSSLDISIASENSNHQPRYIFYFIGDGMGMAQAQIGQEYLQAKHKTDTGYCFFNFPIRTFVTTFAETRKITGSAAAGTALASGIKTSINTIGKTTDRTCNAVTISDICKQSNIKIGILSSVHLNHATPASFYAHNNDRNNYYEIAQDIPASGVDFFAGGGLKYPQGKGGKRSSIYEQINDAGYYIPTSYQALAEAGKETKIFFDSKKALHTDILQYRIDRQSQSYPTLADLTEKASDHLYNKTGFFMMVEGGAIDWTCHSNDAASLVQETIDFELAIRKAYAFYLKHKDSTLIVVTADHETGGLGLGSATMKYEMNLPILENQKRSLGIIQDSVKSALANHADFATCKAIIGYFTGLGTTIMLSSEENNLLIDAYTKSMKEIEAGNEAWQDLLSPTAVKLLAAKAGVGWTTNAHTCIQVPVYAIGAGSEQFMSVKDNTDIPKLLKLMIAGTETELIDCSKK